MRPGEISPEIEQALKVHKEAMDRINGLLATHDAVHGGEDDLREAIDDVLFVHHPKGVLCPECQKLSTLLAKL